MFKRNSVDRNDSMQHFREALTLPAYQVYSKGNRYERFSLQNGVKPVMELYNVAIPAYVDVTYEVMIWTSFTEHMNEIVEQFQYANDRYWGIENGFKFELNFNHEFAKEFDIDISVNGSGFMSRAVAVRSCIAKALVKAKGKKLKETFTAYDRTLLVDDVRKVESKKPLGRKARKKRQHSKR